MLVIFLTVTIGYHITFDISRKLGVGISLLDWIVYILTIPIMMIATVLAIILWLPPTMKLWTIRIKELVR